MKDYAKTRGQELRKNCKLFNAAQDKKINNNSNADDDYYNKKLNFQSLFTLSLIHIYKY